MTFTETCSAVAPESTDRTVLIRTAQGGLAAVPVRRRDALAASLRSSSLDLRLANGEEPERDRLLAVRAALTTRPAARESLARHVDRLLLRVRGPVPIHELRVPVDRVRIMKSANDFDRLVTVLRSDRPVGAAGVASATLLLTDGASPIYLDGGRTDLRSELRSALGTLEMR